MALPDFNMRPVAEAGVHFGHQTHRRNPKMARSSSASATTSTTSISRRACRYLHQALVTVRDVVAGGGRVLFVGTKRQASEPVAVAARQCAQLQHNHRWLGGTLTNWKTSRIQSAACGSLTRCAGEARGLTRRKYLNLTRERDKLERAIGGIKDMGGLPALMFVIDTNKETIRHREGASSAFRGCDPRLELESRMASPIRFRQ